MEWQAKVGYWELHRIPLNLAIAGFLFLGKEVFSGVLYGSSQVEPESMFFTFLLVAVLFLFNIGYTATWLISLFLKDFEKSSFKKHLIRIYLSTATAFFLFPLVYWIAN
jgi:hypothetical protein